MLVRCVRQGRAGLVRGQLFLSIEARAGSVLDPMPRGSHNFPARLVGKAPFPAVSELGVSASVCFKLFFFLYQESPYCVFCSRISSLLLNAREGPSVFLQMPTPVSRSLILLLLSEGPPSHPHRLPGSALRLGLAGTHLKGPTENVEPKPGWTETM